MLRQDQRPGGLRSHDAARIRWTRRGAGRLSERIQRVQECQVEFINLHVVSDGKLGVAESVQHMSATDNSGKPIDMIFRVTDVWRKEKDGWKIIHSHISLPVDMASGNADLESK
jgi:hypothetical protein